MHVGDVVEGGQILRRVVARRPGSMSIEVDDLSGEGRDPRDGGGLREQHRHGGVAEHVLQSGRRIGRVEPDVRPACLEGGERRDDRDRRPVVAQPDPHARTHPERSQAVGKGVRTAFQLAVGQAQRAVAHRKVVRARPGRCGGLSRCTDPVNPPPCTRSPPKSFRRLPVPIPDVHRPQPGLVAGGSRRLRSRSATVSAPSRLMVRVMSAANHCSIRSTPRSPAAPSA